MKMTRQEAQEQIDICRARLTELQTQFRAEQQKAVFLQGYIQALSDDESEEEPTPLRAVERAD